MVNPTIRPHQTPKSRPQSRCTPQRCGVTGLLPHHCPQRPASPAPAVPPPCGVGSLLGRRQRRGSCKGFGHTKISKAAIPLTQSCEQGSLSSASEHWARCGVTLVNDSQDGPGGQVEWEANRFHAAFRGYTTAVQSTRRLGPHQFQHSISKGAGGGVKPSEVVTRVGRQAGSTRDRSQAARQSHRCS